ncbi:MAG: hypothetical protein ACREPM_00350 [Gemmatimonadaceae bacterium]
MLSAYVDGSTADPAGQRTWRLHLDRAIKDLRTWLDGSARGERGDFEHCVEALVERLTDFDPTVGAPGWVAFITRDGVIDAQSVPVPVETQVVWSNGPCISPYLKALSETRPVVIAIVDARKAELHRHYCGGTDRVETIRARGIDETGTHMGDAPRQGFHGGTRGSTGRDSAQQAMLGSRDRMLAEAAARATELAGPDGWILVGGIPGVAAHLEELLSVPAEGRVSRIDHLDVHATEANIADVARAGATRMREDREVKRIAEIVDRAEAGGLGTLGTAATRNALGAESVNELFVTPAYLADHAPDAEDAVRIAFDQRADVEEVTGRAAELLDAHGGIGAELRFQARGFGRDMVR